MALMGWVKRILKNLIIFLIGTVLLVESTMGPGDESERLRVYTRMIEFDFINWTVDALLVKNVQETIQTPDYLKIDAQRKVVYEYMRLLNQTNRLSAVIDNIYANPDVSNPDQTAAGQIEQLRIINDSQQSLKPIAEAILQHQVSTIIADIGLGVGGQPIPPVLYHATSLPDALIISPRSVIREDEDISLVPGLTIQQINKLENDIAKNMDVSVLVVPIGGVGIYPTMVMDTTDLQWLLETISHEWTHNFLTLRPLGALYMASPEMRIINETTANLSGKEIGQAVLERYYPELVPPAPVIVSQNNPKPAAAQVDPNAFSFNREMHNTRVHVDELLAAGKIQEAENYMEAQRRVFWNHGYQIRKLNQAYFAFYGAYNDVPGGGAAGQDPIGPTVQTLRKQSKSLADFLNKIAWVTSFEDLKKLLKP